MGKKKNKHPYKVFGNIFAKIDVELINTFIQGDIRGRNVKIGKQTEITGKVYYIDTIEIEAKTTLTTESFGLVISEIWIHWIWWTSCRYCNDGRRCSREKEMDDTGTFPRPCRCN